MCVYTCICVYVHVCVCVCSNAFEPYMTCGCTCHGMRASIRKCDLIALDMSGSLESHYLNIHELEVIILLG